MSPKDPHNLGTFLLRSPSEVSHSTSLLDMADLLLVVPPPSVNDLRKCQDKLRHDLATGKKARCRKKWQRGKLKARLCKMSVSCWVTSGRSVIQVQSKHLPRGKERSSRTRMTTSSVIWGSLRRGRTHDKNLQLKSFLEKQMFAEGGRLNAAALLPATMHPPV